MVCYKKVHTPLFDQPDKSQDAIIDPNKVFNGQSELIL